MIRRRRQGRGPIALVALALAISCGSPSLAPDEVALSFWEAMSSGDLESADRYVTAASVNLLDAADVPETVENILVGETLKNERAAIVRTSMVTVDNDVTLNLLFNTHLVLEDEAWKVDVGATQEEVARAGFAAGMKLVGEAIGQGIQEFGAALEQGAEEVKRAIREAFAELEGERL